MRIIHGMNGLGDNIYGRPFIKRITQKELIYLRTPWPELYSDLPNIQFVNPDTYLRTQAKNAARFIGWAQEPVGKAQRISYGANPIWEGLKVRFGVEPKCEMDLPDFGASPVPGKYVVIRPVTVRDEWRADSRNPLPEYVAMAAQMAMDRGYAVVSVADLCEEEWIVGELPPAHIYFHGGELPVEKLMALVQGASAIIGGIGWIVPASIAAKVPAWIICGGNGGYNAPERITDPSMDLSRIEFAVPDKFCRCTEKFHDCKKEISNYAEKFASWADRHLIVV